VNEGVGLQGRRAETGFARRGQPGLVDGEDQDLRLPGKTLGGLCARLGALLGIKSSAQHGGPQTATAGRSARG
jgi:hypothetical protein